MITGQPRDRRDYRYTGRELELFANATQWKSYFQGQLAPYIRGHVLEVGAGIGETTRYLSNRCHDSWMCLEPDAELAEQLGKVVTALDLPPKWEVRVGDISDLKSDEFFDTILYIDVLEHIEDDVAEMNRASSHLAPGGRLVVLSPAHQFLFSSFDRALGHFRRYTRATLSATMPSILRRRRIFYLDSVGMIASLANRVLLGQSLPTLRQIEFWDKGLVPMSRVVDTLVGYAVGRSVVAIYEKSGMP